MTIVGNEPTIPAGMKRWAGGDSAPADAASPLLLRGGEIWKCRSLLRARWSHVGDLSDIIAYTPRAPGEAREIVGKALCDHFTEDWSPDGNREDWLAAADVALAALRPPARDGECELREAAQRCRDLAMHWMAMGRVPEIGPFGQIAQDLDAALSADRSDPAGEKS